MGPGPTKIGNMLASAKMNMLRKRALRLDKKIKQSGLTPEQSKKVSKMDKRFGKAVEKIDQIMQKRDKEYGREMKEPMEESPKKTLPGPESPTKVPYMQREKFGSRK